MWNRPTQQILKLYAPTVLSIQGSAGQTGQALTEEKKQSSSSEFFGSVSWL